MSLEKKFFEQDLVMSKIKFQVASATNTNYRMKPADQTIRVNAATHVFSVYLPPVAEAIGKFYVIGAAGGNNVTVREAGDSEDWAGNVTLNGTGASTTLDWIGFYSDGRKWLSTGSFTYEVAQQTNHYPQAAVSAPAMKSATFTFTHEALDATATSQTIDTGIELPIGARFVQTLIKDITGFTGGGLSTMVVTAGDGTDPDRYNTGTPSIFATIAAVDAGAPSGTVYHAAAKEIILTVTCASHLCGDFRPSRIDWLCSRNAFAHRYSAFCGLVSGLLQDLKRGHFAPAGVLFKEAVRQLPPRPGPC